MLAAMVGIIQGYKKSAAYEVGLVAKPLDVQLISGNSIFATSVIVAAITHSILYEFE